MNSPLVIVIAGIKLLPENPIEREDQDAHRLHFAMRYDVHSPILALPTRFSSTHQMRPCFAHTIVGHIRMIACRLFVGAGGHSSPACAELPYLIEFEVIYRLEFCAPSTQSLAQKCLSTKLFMSLWSLFGQHYACPVLTIRVPVRNQRYGENGEHLVPRRRRNGFALSTSVLTTSLH